MKRASDARSPSGPSARNLPPDEDKYRRLFEHMTEGFFIAEIICDSSGRAVDYRYLDVNPAFEPLTGLKREAVVGRTVRDILPAVEPAWIDTYGRVALTGQPATIEAFAAPLGRYYRTVAYWTGPGQFACLFMDVTDVRTAANAVQEEKDRLSALIGSMTDEVWFCDASKQFTLANPSAAREFNIASPARVGVETLARSLEVLRPDGSPRPVEEAPPLRALSGEIVRGQEEIIRTPATGELRYRDVNAAPVRDATGAIIGAVSVVRDITDRVRSEQALRASEQRHRRFFDSGMVGVIYWDLDGTITGANDKFLEMVGYSRADLEAGLVAWNRMTPPEYAERDRAAIDDLKATGLDTPYEKEYIRKDGTRVPIIIGAAMLDEERRNGVAFVLDITKRKRAEAEVERALTRERDARREAELANRTKDEFLAGVSHELRSPLNAILGWAVMLRSNAAMDERTRQRALEAIERGARAQRQLIDDLLDLARIESGKMRLDVQPVELVPVIEAAIDAVRPAAEAKHLDLQVILDPGASPVSGDPDRLQQIVWNLLSNAIKFTDKQGHIQVRLERVNSHVEIVIADSGCGIEADLLPHIFERFRQGAQPRNAGGLGLGLTIVRQLVELHGGTVRAESAGPGLGATFTVHLPLRVISREAAPRAMPSIAVSDRSPDLHGVRVLAVDDEPETRAVMQAILAGAGGEVRVVESADEALSALALEPWDVIVCDIEMPGRDGYWLIEHLRQLPAERPVPAVALTAYGRMQDRVRALSAGFDIHVTKPVEPAELLVVIAHLAERSRA